ncbi:MAG: DUF3106 domain-containing protein [Burkholderiales bacterium]|nr:DUF3106 domain-containing protein [Burkholderiales bacterium]
MPLLAAPPAPTTPPAVASVSGPAWASLAPAQQQALAPIRPGWDALDPIHKMKWIDVANRFPGMPADERRRVQERMAAWAAMTPAERARARVQFQETRRIGAETRQERWLAYQALPDDERKRLAQAAGKPAAPSASAASRASAAATPGTGSSKRNLVASTPTPPPRAVAPTVVQAKPGASTNTVAAQARPPMHHQHGLPKIVATPGFVDPKTLLPRRGPQAAAMRTAASSDPTRQP